MSPSLPPDPARNLLTCRFRSGDALRSRSVSDIVRSGTVDVPAPPVRLVADWERDISLRLDLEPGDVEELPLARARARWPDYRQCVQAVSDWTRTLGLGDVLASADTALMACRGARYHHDGDRYGGFAFCNLFVSEDEGLEVHFPFADRRIPLARGTVLIFDTGQPHAVVERGATGFDPADFAPGKDRTQVFLTWELPIENAEVARALGIAFDLDGPLSAPPDEEQVRLDGARLAVCPTSGKIAAAPIPDDSERTHALPMNPPMKSMFDE
jgi:hypothetical protein